MALKAAYPTLPITSNCLDPRQRAQLLRSSKKLAKVLGATPRFVDVNSEEPGYIFCESEDSFESRPSYASSTISSRPSSSSSISSISELFPRGGSRHGRSNSEPPSPTSPDTPFMRVVLPAQTEDGFSLRPHSRSRRASSASTSSSSSTSPPPFSLPSSQSQKRAKMDRLRRKFGDEIPIELVFPTQSSLDSDIEEEEEKEEAEPIQVISERGAQFIVVQGFNDNLDSDKPLPFLPPPSPTRKNSPRDSLLVHRIRRKMVCYQDENEKGGSEFRLSLIMECPQAEDCWR